MIGSLRVALELEPPGQDNTLMPTSGQPPRGCVPFLRFLHLTLLVPEVPHSSKHHGQPQLVGGVNHFLVAH